MRVGGYYSNTTPASPLYNMCFRKCLLAPPTVTGCGHQARTSRGFGLYCVSLLSSTTAERQMPGDKQIHKHTHLFACRTGNAPQMRDMATHTSAGQWCAPSRVTGSRSRLRCPCSVCPARNTPWSPARCCVSCRSRIMSTRQTTRSRGLG